MANFVDFLLFLFKLMTGTLGKLVVKLVVIAYTRKSEKSMILVKLPFWFIAKAS